MHFNRDFETVYRNAVSSYQRIEASTGVIMRSPREHLSVLSTYLHNNQFDLELFRSATLARSKSAAQRETNVLHAQEYLGDGAKAYFYIKNLIGGEYHFTADEVYDEGEALVIQESKNATLANFPKLADIKDRLLKLILYTNLDELYLSGKRIDFSTRLKITGNLVGSLQLPSETGEMARFSEMNRLKRTEQALLSLMNDEASQNRNLQISIAGRQ
jgi:hypothetical protein